MQINNLSFTSKINFVDKTHFDNTVNGEYVAFSDDPNHPDSIKKANEFYTYAVRTCTAGGLIDSSKNEAVGFHYYDGQKNYLGLEEYVDRLFKNVKNPDKALILGGKTLLDSPYSMQQFLKIKELLSQRVENLTILEEHTYPWSETDLHYSLDDDTWTIQSMYSPQTDYRDYSALSPEELKKIFKNIKIAPSDRLQIKGLDIII